MTLKYLITTLRLRTSSISINVSCSVTPDEFPHMFHAQAPLSRLKVITLTDIFWFPLTFSEPSWFTWCGCKSGFVFIWGQTLKRSYKWSGWWSLGAVTPFLQRRESRLPSTARDPGSRVSCGNIKHQVGVLMWACCVCERGSRSCHRGWRVMCVVCEGSLWLRLRGTFRRWGGAHSLPSFPLPRSTPSRPPPRPHRIVTRRWAGLPGHSSLIVPLCPFRHSSWCNACMWGFGSSVDRKCLCLSNSLLIQTILFSLKILFCVCLW